MSWLVGEIFSVAVPSVLSTKLINPGMEKPASLSRIKLKRKLSFSASVAVMVNC